MNTSRLAPNQEVGKVPTDSGGGDRLDLGHPSSSKWSRAKRLSWIGKKIDVRGSFTGKMAISGSRNKSKLSKKNVVLPPADDENPEKNWDSVSTLGYSGGASTQDLMNGTMVRADSKHIGAKEADFAKLDRSARMSMDLNDLAPSRRWKPFTKLEIVRRISEGLEEELDQDEDNIDSLKKELVVLKKKLQEKTEEVVKLEVKLEVAHELIQELKEERASTGGSGENSSYDAHVLKSRIKELEEKNRSLSKQLCTRLS